MSLSLKLNDSTKPAAQVSKTESLMHLTGEASPALGRSLKDFGEWSIDKFLSQIPINTADAYQSSEDLLTYIDSYVSRTLGPETAARTINDLRKHSMILTANHHGVDYFAQSLQGSLLFSNLKTSLHANCTTVPVFACGNIPLNNLTYPRGALIYKISASMIDKIPLNLPLYSDKRKRAIVSAVEPFDGDMIQRSLKRLKLWRQDNLVNPIIANTIESIFNDVYGSPDVLSQKSYSDQAVMVNHRIWKQLFTSEQSAPDLIYLELERIVAHLLSKDLQTPNRLATMLIMDDSYREKLINVLDGTVGCWNQKMLAQRINASCEGSNPYGSAQTCGTHFFWGIDDRGRRFPLCLTKGTGGLNKLAGIDDRGKNWSYDFNVSEIIQALRNRRLVPSLFTSYMTISFARGVTCIGGYYQSSYLPKMQHGVVNVLKQFGDHNAAEKIAAIPSNGYLSGMQSVTTTIDKKYLIPAGPVEIIASGGISDKEYDAIQKMNVYDAHMASLCDTVVDVLPRVARTTQWKGQLFSELFQQLYRNTICKRFSIIN